MPINPKLKDQLTAQIADTAYRDRLIATLEDAPPEVQNNWMSQEDYTRQVNKFKEDQKEWKSKADKFYSDSNASIDGWKADLQKANDAKAAAEARIATLEAGGGNSDAASAEIKGLKDMLTKIDAKFGTVVSREDLDKAYQNAVGFMGDQVLTLGEMQDEHMARTGKRLSKAEVTEIVNHANELAKVAGHRVGLDEAYKSKYSNDLKTHEREQIRKEELEKLKSSEVPNGGAGGGIGPGGPGKGPLEIRLEDLRKIDAGEGKGIARTWQEAAAEGADELVKEGKY